MIFKFIRGFFYRLIIGLMRRMNICAIKKTKYGVKGLNNWYGSPIPVSNKCIYLSSEDLFLEKDFLKDDYTLVNVNISNSPHYDFMNSLLTGKNIKSTDYIKRFEGGFLDGRLPSYVSKKKIAEMKRIFEKMVNEVTLDEYEPVLVYNSNSKYYIYDGKHRAALCALFNKKVKCVLIKKIDLSDSIVFSKYKLIKNNNKYLKTINFLEML